MICKNKTENYSNTYDKGHYTVEQIDKNRFGVKKIIFHLFLDT